jgi:hypothetical protein
MYKKLADSVEYSQKIILSQSTLHGYTQFSFSNMNSNRFYIDINDKYSKSRRLCHSGGLLTTRYRLKAKNVNNMYN